MEDDPYKKYKKDELILRDWLAVDRTVLANERTFLAYIRTAFAIFIVGAGLIILDQERLGLVGLFILFPLGMLLFFVGVYRYVKTRNTLKHLAEDRPKKIKTKDKKKSGKKKSEKKE